MSMLGELFLRGQKASARGARMGSTCEASEGAEDARDGGGGGVLQIQENGVLLQTKEQQRD